MGATGGSAVPELGLGPILYQTLDPYVTKRFEWRIQGCSRLLSATEGDEAKENYSRKSPKFLFMNRTWFLQLFPNTQPAMHLFLYLVEGDIPVTVNINFGISKVYGAIEWKIQRLCRYVSDNKWNYNFHYRRAKTLISKVDLNNRMSEFVQDDVLTIVCSISSEECLEFFRENVYKNEASIPLSLLPEARPSNLALIIQNIKMVVDHNILRLYCPVVASQVKPGGTYMLDFDPRVYRRFLLYLYTGKIVVMEMKELLLLFSLAITYKMYLLRDRCLCLITATMVPENALTVLIFAENLKEKDLTKIAYKFIFEHATQVFSSSIWMEFLRKFPYHANELFRLMGQTYKKRLGLSSSEEFSREALKFHF